MNNRQLEFSFAHEVTDKSNFVLFVRGNVRLAIEKVNSWQDCLAVTLIKLNVWNETVKDLTFTVNERGVLLSSGFTVITPAPEAKKPTVWNTRKDKGFAVIIQNKRRVSEIITEEW